MTRGLNAYKTRKMTINELREHYLYEALTLLDKKEYDQSFEYFYNLYKKNKNNIRYDTYIKRLFCESIKLEKFNSNNRKKIVEIVLMDDFLLICNARNYSRIWRRY